MASQGIASPFSIQDLAVLGVSDALRAYPLVLRRAEATARLAAREQPDAVVLIDSWGFMLRVARRLRKLRKPPILIKYVAPQVWATRPGRARTLARTVDHLLTIHSFDAPAFTAEGLATTFVGNPVLNRDFSQADGARFRQQRGIGPDAALLLLLPGSRRGEVERLMPVFLKAVGVLRQADPSLCIGVVAADSQTDTINQALASWPHPIHRIDGEADRLDAMRAATVAVACSGTVTTELALAGCPMVVAYRVGALTYAVAKRLIRTPYITLFNVAAQTLIAPELVQDACTGEALAREVSLRLRDPGLREDQIFQQTSAVSRMRGGVQDPADAAASAVIGVLARA